MVSVTGSLRKDDDGKITAEFETDGTRYIFEFQDDSGLPQTWSLNEVILDFPDVEALQGPMPVGGHIAPDGIMLDLGPAKILSMNESLEGAIPEGYGVMTEGYWTSR